jgi:hypothetical protein
MRLLDKLSLAIYASIYVMPVTAQHRYAEINDSVSVVRYITDADSFFYANIKKIRKIIKEKKEVDLFAREEGTNTRMYPDLVDFCYTIGGMAVYDFSEMNIPPTFNCYVDTFHYYVDKRKVKNMVKWYKGWRSEISLYAFRLHYYYNAVILSGRGAPSGDHFFNIGAECDKLVFPYTKNLTKQKE